MEPIILRIAGESKTKQRQRFDPRIRRAFSPPANIINENNVLAIWREAGEPRIEDDVAIRITILIGVARPKGHFKKDGSLSSTGLRMPVPRNKKPDADNAAKLIMDALNTKAYKDDVQISELLVSKRWADWPATIVMIQAAHAPVA